jgi:hypothetical protein
VWTRLRRKKLRVILTHEKTQQVRIDIPVSVCSGGLLNCTDRRIRICPRTFTGDSNRIFADDPDFGFDHLTGVQI